jgi:hypothetical protein
MSRLTYVACGLVLLTAGAGRPAVAVPTAEPGTTRPAAEESIPPDELKQIDQSELGKRYQPGQAQQLLDAHELIEKYFASSSSVERKSIVSSLEATKIDPNVLGRLCRIHLHWPELTGGGVFYLNQRIGPYDVRYFIGVPKEYDRAKPWPLVIKLPGAAEFLTTPPPDAKRVVEIYTAWLKDELVHHPDAIVLMPLLNLDELYGPSYAGMNSVIQPLLDAPNHVNVDPARVYMLGHSMAAHGVWNLALHYPTYFAAICPLAGSASSDWQRVRLMNLRNVLPVVWHDDKDPVIKVGFSKGLVTALRNLKIEVSFDETNGIGHAPSDDIVEEEYHKMRAKVRDLYPPQVWLASNRPDIVFNRSDWVQVYQQVQTGKERRLLFHHGTGHMTVYPDAYTLRATIKDNRIDATTDNVSVMRFYVNDQMVDFSKPVTVTVNRKVRFQGVLKPSVGVMLKDQVFLGRGWRYFTAVVDVDLLPPATRPATRKSATSNPAVK